MAGHRGAPYYDIFLRYEMWLENVDNLRVLDSEGFALLSLIREKGSLTAAARELGISYRKAWGILREVEHHLGFPLVERQRGGASGGHSGLTPQGRLLLTAYNNLINETDAAMKSIAKVFFNRVNDINIYK